MKFLYDNLCYFKVCFQWCKKYRMFSKLSNLEKMKAAPTGAFDPNWPMPQLSSLCALDLSHWGPERVIILMSFKAYNSFCLVLLEWSHQRVTVAFRKYRLVWFQGWGKCDICPREAKCFYHPSQLLWLWLWVVPKNGNFPIYLYGSDICSKFQQLSHDGAGCSFFGSFGNEPMQSCSVRHCCWHHWYLCTALPVTGLIIEASYLTNICSYDPSICTWNIKSMWHIF